MMAERGIKVAHSTIRSRTGTSGKTQAVTHGDTIEIKIEGVGRLRNSVGVR
jgi:2-keto-4-pentenoate hydratase/2-oxohepta-3-ene-1,7-dioic acid hydratase in catechol pathway